MGMWNREKETLSRDELAKVQLEGLKKSLNRVWNNEFYRERLKKGGVGSPEDVKSLDDLANLPFYTKDDFRDAYPLKMNCADRKDLLEFHMSSGSTGTPVVMAYTKGDLVQWAECMARGGSGEGRRVPDHPHLRPLQRRLRLLPRRAQGRALHGARLFRQHRAPDPPDEGLQVQGLRVRRLLRAAAHREA